MATASTSSPPVEVERRSISLLGYGKDALLSSLLVLNSALAAIDVRKNYQADNLLAGFEFFVWCTKQNRLLLEGVSHTMCPSQMTFAALSLFRLFSLRSQH
jgi:hypothetical protein